MSERHHEFLPSIGAFSASTALAIEALEHALAHENIVGAVAATSRVLSDVEAMRTRLMELSVTG